MSVATVRTKLQARVAFVPSVGVVTDFEPYADREEVFRMYFKHPGLDYILGWTITRERTDESPFELQANMADHLFVIRGYRALAEDGATEKAFQDLIELIRDRLRLEQVAQLDGVATLVGPPSVRLVELRQLSDFKIHYCEITLRVSEMVA